VTVTSGTGGGSYFADTVQIGADAASSEQFTGWTGNVAFSDALSPTTTFTMPAADVIVTATYGVEDEIRYYPRTGFLSRMIGGVFEGTNGDLETGTTRIHTITATPPLAWTSAT
jgi:Divergent InlB B-repeat domain